MNQHRFGGPWTVEKLDALRAYLNGYAQALKNRAFYRIYIDAFAGTGDRAAKQQAAATLMDVPELGEVTKGSVRLALEVEPRFGRYIFIENRRRRASALEKLKTEFPDREIDVLNEDANVAVQRICRETNWHSHRAVLFLDPYGMQVSWATLEAVAATKSIDVWMLYPTGMGLNRLLTKDGQVPEEWQETLDRSLGCGDWRDAFYQAKQTVDLFGVTRTELVKDASPAKSEAFLVDRLRSIFTAVSPKALPLKNRKDQIMYVLCFACGNARGAALALRIANSIINKRRR
jgi:three-Cys-motif partner protein